MFFLLTPILCLVRCFCRVDAVNNLESNGHVLNGNTENGVTALNNVAPIDLTKTDQDIVRLIGQYLKIVGLGFVHFLAL